MPKLLPDWPRMMRRATAAAYCDLTAADFEREVAAGRLPLPIHFGGQDHWSRVAIDEALERLAGDRLPDWREGSRLYGKRNAA